MRRRCAGSGRLAPAARGCLPALAAWQDGPLISPGPPATRLHSTGARCSSRSTNMAPRVVTVTGPVPPERIGFTLPHEHLSCRPELVSTRQELIDFTSDAEVMTDELHDFRRRGGSCVVDLSSGGLARDPTWLRSLATRSGLLIVMGAGWYRGSFYPPEASIDRRSVEDLAGEVVAEFEHGVGDTGVHPGIIGEIGTDHS